MDDNASTPTRLERWFPYTRLRSALVVLAVTGVWLHLSPRFGSPSWGLTEWLHSGLGLFSIALYGAYQVHHLAAKWPERHRASSITGGVTAVAVVVAEATGLMLLGPLDAVSSVNVRDLHLAATVGLGGGLILHLRARRRPR